MSSLSESLPLLTASCFARPRAFVSERIAVARARISFCFSRASTRSSCAHVCASSACSSIALICPVKSSFLVEESSFYVEESLQNHHFLLKNHHLYIKTHGLRRSRPPAAPACASSRRCLGSPHLITSSDHLIWRDDIHDGTKWNHRVQERQWDWHAVHRPAKFIGCSKIHNFRTIDVGILQNSSLSMKVHRFKWIIPCFWYTIPCFEYKIHEFNSPVEKVLNALDLSPRDEVVNLVRIIDEVDWVVRNASF